MANDNTLGAPTEGLGQTVTFSAGGGGGVPQTRARERSAIRNNSSGGGAQRTAQALQVQEARPDPTFQALAKLGGEMLRPHIEAERTAKYVEGMQKAAQGQAITEIIDEQPWYSKLFGSTSLVDGARAYTASAKATSVAVDMESRMDEIRKMSPADFAKHSTDVMLKAKTGDAATDMMITQQVASTLPAVMKSQAKAHVRYKQEVLEENIGSAAEAAFALLGVNDAQARGPESTKDEADVLGAGLKVLEVLTPPSTMEPERFNKIVAQRAVKAILGGNFAVANVLEQSKRLESMSPEEQTAIRAATLKARTDAKLKLPLGFAERLEEWDSMSDDPEKNSRETILAGAEKVNQEYTTLTGDKAPFIDVGATARNLAQRTRAEKQALDEQLRKVDRESNAVAKAEAKMQATTMLAGLMTGNTYVGGYKKEEREDAWNYIDATANPDTRAGIMVRQAGFENINEQAADIMRGNVASAFLGGGNPGLLHKVYQEQYLPLVKAAGDQGEVVARKYAGSHGEAMSLYHRLAQGRVLDQTNQDILYTEIARPKPKEAKNKEAIVKELTNGLFVRAVKGVFQRDQFQPVDPEGLANELASSVDTKLPLDQAVTLAKSQDASLSVVGGYHWRRSTSSADLRSWLLGQKDGRVAAGEENRATRMTINKVAELSGIEGNPRIEQIADKNGVPQFYALGAGSDGKVKIGLFTAEDIAVNWAKFNEEVEPNLYWTKNPESFVPGKTPSIYASPAEWAAYRKQQANQPK